MHTQAHELLLRRIPHKEHVFGQPRKQVLLYDDMMVDSVYKNYLLEQVRIRKYKTVLKKLTEEDINRWKPKQPESWELIDPYSDIEVVYSSDSNIESSCESTAEVANKPSEDQRDTEPEQEMETGTYNLHDRSSHRRNPRPQRSTKRSVNYCVDRDDLGLPKSPKVQKPSQRATPYGPSEDRIASHRKRTVAPKVTHPIPVKRPLKVETDDDDNDLPAESEAETVVDASAPKTDPAGTASPDTGSDSGDNIPLSKLHQSISDDTTPKNGGAKQKRVLVTRKVGIKKYKRKRSFRCKICNTSFPMLAEANCHHKQHHDKVHCTVCGQLFRTPSTLAHHMYTHQEAKKPCRCGKTFRFASELKVHKLTHRRIKTQHCIHPGSGRSYFSSSELSKHAKTHEDILWKCLECKYTLDDKRLLKSHQRVHIRKIKYTCAKCGKGFIFHTQWCRHKDANNCVSLKRSSSPEH